MLFLFQHSILSGLNPTRVIIGLAEPLPIEGSNVMEIISEAIEIVEDNLKQLREELHDYARPLCREDEDIPLPLFCMINYSILLIDPDKVYPWHPSCCPEALHPLWAANVEGGLQKSATTLPSCRGYLEVDYWGNSQESKLYC